MNAKQNAAIPWKIRPTEKRDQSIVAKLLSNASDRHLHLDWYSTNELLEERPSLLAFEQERAVAILACPPDPESISWIRFFAVSEGSPTLPLWELLWQHTLALAPKAMIATIAALVTQSWFPPLLLASGFAQTTEVIFLEWQGEGLCVDLPLDATLRTMSLEDLNAVARVDQDAFQPLWQHSLRALKAAYHLSSLATVIEVDQQVVAYQISTSSALGAHLARLAVDPGVQGRGLAQALVNHAFRHFQRRGIERMSVNTQADNSRSQLLYEKLGFIPTGQRFPVFTYHLEAIPSHTLN